MQTVSASWREAQLRHIVPESFVEVSYKVSDPVAEADATATDNGALGIADTAQVVDTLDKNYGKYATLEHNIWILDGSVDVYTGAVTQDTGYISSVMSGDNGSFSSHPIITITFTQIHTNVIPGLTIRWGGAYGEWARGYIVTAYNGTTVVANKTVTNNSDATTIIDTDIDNFNKITIEITDWCLPYRRARVEEIIIGVKSVFGKAELVGYEHSQSVDLLSLELPKAQIVFNISNVNGNWNPDNPAGVMKYLLERQEIRVRYGFKIDDSIEWIKAGTFYMSEWDTPTNGITATFTARDLVEFMNGKFVATSGTFTLTQLATQAFTQAGLPTLPDGTNRWEIDASLGAISVTINPAEFDYTIAEVLQLCANAACCVLYQDRNGKMRIEPLSTVLTDYLIDGFVSHTNPEYSISKELKSVDVNKNMGTVENSVAGETQPIENPLIQNATVANAVAAWVKDCLKGRKTLSGTYRPDPRLDALDRITTKNKYAENTAVITNIKYTYNGAFKGEYTGRVGV